MSPGGIRKSHESVRDAARMLFSRQGGPARWEVRFLLRFALVLVFSTWLVSCTLAFSWPWRSTSRCCSLGVALDEPLPPPPPPIVVSFVPAPSFMFVCASGKPVGRVLVRLLSLSRRIVLLAAVGSALVLMGARGCGPVWSTADVSSGRGCQLRRTDRR